MAYEAGDRNGQVTRFGEYGPGERRSGLLRCRGSPPPFGYNLWKEREFPAVAVAEKVFGKACGAARGSGVEPSSVDAAPVCKEFGRLRI
jgi:hypothetical protein